MFGSCAKIDLWIFCRYYAMIRYMAVMPAWYFDVMP